MNGTKEIFPSPFEGMTKIALTFIDFYYHVNRVNITRSFSTIKLLQYDHN